MPVGLSGTRRVVDLAAGIAAAAVDCSIVSLAVGLEHVGAGGEFCRVPGRDVPVARIGEKASEHSSQPLCRATDLGTAPSASSYVLCCAHVVRRPEDIKDIGRHPKTLIGGAKDLL